MRKNLRNLHMTLWRRNKCHTLLKTVQQEMIGYRDFIRRHPRINHLPEATSIARHRGIQ
jgi:hypothetical protein